MSLFVVVVVVALQEVEDAVRVTARLPELKKMPAANTGLRKCISRSKDVVAGSVPRLQLDLCLFFFTPMISSAFMTRRVTGVGH